MSIRRNLSQLSLMLLTLLLVPRIAAAAPSTGNETLLTASKPLVDVKNATSPMEVASVQTGSQGKVLVQCNGDPLVCRTKRSSDGETRTGTSVDAATQRLLDDLAHDLSEDGRLDAATVGTLEDSAAELDPVEMRARFGRYLAAADEEAIAKIRALYHEAGEFEQVPENERSSVTMKLATVQPGSGPQTTTFTMLLGEHRKDEDQVYPDLYVRKVSASWNFAARSHAAEYLFDGIGGELVFHFATDGMEEVRTYWKGGEVIRIMRKPAPDSGVEGEAEVKDGGFSAEERAEAEKIQDRAARHLETYRQLDRAIEGEHGS